MCYLLAVPLGHVSDLRFKAWCYLNWCCIWGSRLECEDWLQATHIALFLLNTILVTKFCIKAVKLLTLLGTFTPKVAFENLNFDEKFLEMIINKSSFNGYKL